MVWGALFGTFFSQNQTFQIKSVISEDMVTLPREPQFIRIDSNRRVGIISKRLAYSKMNLKKPWKLTEIGLGEKFPAKTRSFQIKTVVSKNLLILAEDTKFVWVDSNKRVSQ